MQCSCSNVAELNMYIYHVPIRTFYYFKRYWAVGPPPWSAAPAHVGTLSALWRPTNNIKTSRVGGGGEEEEEAAALQLLVYRGLKREICVSRPQDIPCVGPSLCSSLSSGWATRGLRTAHLSDSITCINKVLGHQNNSSSIMITLKQQSCTIL